MIRSVQLHPVTALTAYVCGLGFGIATIISLVPAVVKLVRMFVQDM
jgi:hypothetical protein